MDSRNESALLGGVRAPGVDYQKQADSTPKRKIPSKWRRVLGALLTGRRFHRFEAERELHDHCLPSTVSTIQGKGVQISRKEICVPGYQGIATYVSQYWIDPDPANVARARALVEGEPCA